MTIAFQYCICISILCHIPILYQRGNNLTLGHVPILCCIGYVSGLYPIHTMCNPFGQSTSRSMGIVWPLIGPSGHYHGCHRVPWHTKPWIPCGAYIPNLDMHVGQSTLELWIWMWGFSTLEPWIRLCGCSTLEPWILPWHVEVSIWWRHIRVGVHHWPIPCTYPWIRVIRGGVNPCDNPGTHFRIVGCNNFPLGGPNGFHTHGRPQWVPFSNWGWWPWKWY